MFTLLCLKEGKRGNSWIICYFWLRWGKVFCLGNEAKHLADCPFCWENFKSMSLWLASSLALLDVKHWSMSLQKVKIKRNIPKSISKIIKRDYSCDFEDLNHFSPNSFKSEESYFKVLICLFLVRPRFLMVYILGLIESFFLSYRFNLYCFVFF